MRPGATWPAWPDSVPVLRAGRGGARDLAGLLAGTTLPLWDPARLRRLPGETALGAHTQGIMIGRFPHGPHALGASGIYVDTVRSALVVAAIARPRSCCSTICWSWLADAGPGAASGAAGAGGLARPGAAGARTPGPLGPLREPLRRARRLSQSPTPGHELARPGPPPGESPAPAHTARPSPRPSCYPRPPYESPGEAACASPESRHARNQASRPAGCRPPASDRLRRVERIAGWSVRHRKTAVLGWLLLVVAHYLAAARAAATAMSDSMTAIPARPSRS